MNILKTSYFEITKRDIKQAYKIEKSCKDDPTPYYEKFEDFENALSIQDSILFLLIDYSNNVGGYVTLEPTKNSWYLANIAVKKLFRKCGYGRILLQTAIMESRIRSRKATTMKLHSGADNEPMHSLVVSLGFTIVDRLPKHYWDGQDCIVFRRNILPLTTKEDRYHV